MERKHKWQSQGSLCYVLLSLGCRETSERLIDFNLTKRSGKSAEQWAKTHCNWLSKHMQISCIAHIPPGWTIPFGISFPPLLQKRRKISEPFVWITSARLPAKKKMENLEASYGWYNSIPLLFLVPKKNYHLSSTENFHQDLRISVCVLANRCFPFD